MTNKKRILSGVQPTGDLHIGNWLGAINNWVTLQEQYETFLCVVDLHAITASYNPKELSKNMQKITKTLLQIDKHKIFMKKRQKQLLTLLQDLLKVYQMKKSNLVK